MVELECIKCGVKFECESWNIEEINEGRKEQICERCKSILEEEQRKRSE